MPRRRAPLPASWPPASVPSAPRCGLCEREVQATSRHHLVPREDGGRYGPTVDLCQPCHSSVHRFLSNRDLARRYPTGEALRQAILCCRKGGTVSVLGVFGLMDKFPGRGVIER